MDTGGIFSGYFKGSAMTSIAGKYARTLMIVAFLPVAICFIFILWRPHFRNLHPASIDLRAFNVTSTNVYVMSITNPAACSAIVGVLSTGRPTFGMSKESFELTIRYADGGTDLVYFFPSYDQRYTFIQGWTFTVATNGLYRALVDGGVDITKIQ